MSKIIPLALFVLSVLAPADVLAAPFKTVGELVAALKKDDPSNASMIRMVGESGYGMLVASVKAKRMTGVYLFCVPGKLNLTPEQYVSILSHYVNSSTALQQKPLKNWQVLLMDALVETFPCG